MIDDQLMIDHYYARSDFATIRLVIGRDYNKARDAGSCVRSWLTRNSASKLSTHR